MSLKEAIPTLDTLSSREKLALIEGLWNDVSQEDETLTVTPAQQCLLDARYAEHVANPSAGTTSWSDARDRILKRL